VAEIDFYLGISEKRIHITGAKIADIGRRLKLGEFKLKVEDAKVRKGPPAEYIRASKTFVFRFRLTFSEEEIEETLQLRGSLFKADAFNCGTIVHEFVHAVLHSEGSAIVRLSDEAAAYLAQTLYHVNRESYDSFLKFARKDGAGEIVETARELITKHGLKDSKGKHLNWLQYRPLRKAIHAHRWYHPLGPIERLDD
jgi:hypothetical protein